MTLEKGKWREQDVLSDGKQEFLHEAGTVNPMSGRSANSLLNKGDDKEPSAIDDSPMPLIKTGTSMMPDMKFGWKPEVKCSHPPIPLYFDFVEHIMTPYQFDKLFEDHVPDILVHQEKRVHDSYQMHKKFANRQLCNGNTSYKFNFPKNHDEGRFNYDGLLE